MITKRGICARKVGDCNRIFYIDMINPHDQNISPIDEQNMDFDSVTTPKTRENKRNFPKFMLELKYLSFIAVLSPTPLESVQTPISFQTWNKHNIETLKRLLESKGEIIATRMLKSDIIKRLQSYTFEKNEIPTYDRKNYDKTYREQKKASPEIPISQGN